MFIIREIPMFTNKILLSLLFAIPGVALATPIDNNSTPTPGTYINSNILNVVPTATAPGIATTPKFRLTCKYSGGGVFDPIVFPGQPGAGHHHTFFGNSAMTANSTTAELNASLDSFCQGGTMNKSAYWIPSMYDTTTGLIKKPKDTIIYYSTTKLMMQYVNAIPDGLKMIAPTGGGRYNCEAWPNPSYAGGSTSIPTCTTAGDRLRAKIVFPGCWDGVNLDSADHHSHMAYEATSNPDPNDCPSTHPVKIATFTMIVDWDTTADNETANWRLASDPDGGLPGATFHADYMEGWGQKWMDMIINNCLKTDKDCGVGLLGVDPDDGQLKKAMPVNK
jgi:hypothetical protein